MQSTAASLHSVITIRCGAANDVRTGTEAVVVLVATEEQVNIGWPGSVANIAIEWFPSTNSDRQRVICCDFD